MLKRFIDDGDNFNIKLDTFEALSLIGSVAGTTTVLLDFSNFPNKDITIELKSPILESQATLNKEMMASEDDYNCQ